MPKLIATVGLPGSGKSRRAKQWVDEDPEHRTRVNRDDTRRSMHGRYLGSRAQEKQVSIGTGATIGALLRNGFDVVCDDTNLMPDYVDRLRRIAERNGAEFEVWDMTDVDIEVCVARDSERTGDEHVGEGRIRQMWERRQQALAELAGAST